MPNKIPILVIGSKNSLPFQTMLEQDYELHFCYCSKAVACAHDLDPKCVLFYRESFQDTDFKCLKQFKDHHFRVLTISDNDDPEVLARLFELGADDFIKTTHCEVLLHRKLDHLVSFRNLSITKNLFEKLFQKTSSGICITDLYGNIIDVNETVSKITGYSREEVIGENPRVFKSGRHSEEFYQAMWASLKETGSWVGEIWNRRKCGEVFPEWLTLSQICNDQGMPSHYVAIFSDISKVKEQERSFKYQAEHDPLTGLPNRLLLKDRLDQALLHSDRNADTLTILYCDLNKFKPVNDTYGHYIGDMLLMEVADILQRFTRTGDTVARVGGDEFIILMKGIKEESDIYVATQKIIDQINQPFAIGGQNISIGISIGASRYPKDGQNTEDLLTYADRAMYMAKKNPEIDLIIWNDDASEP